MKHSAFYIILILFLFSSCKNEKEQNNEPPAIMTVGDLTISTKQPQAGETIEIIYKNHNQVEAFYSYLVGANNYPVDIDFESKNGEQKSSIKIPDSALALAFIFKTDDKYDDNDKKGYLIPLHSRDGEKLVGSASAIANYAQYYGPDYGIKMNEKEAMSIMKSELAAHPELQADWQNRYLGAMYKDNKEEGKKEIDMYLESLSKKSEKSEKEYIAMINLYRMTKEESKLDSLRKLTIEKFPNGKMAENNVVTAFGEEKNITKQEQLLSDYSKGKQKLNNIGNYMANNIAMTYYNKGDMTNFEKYSKMVEDKGSRASSLNNLAWELAEKGKNLDEAEKMSKTSIDLVSDMQKNASEKPVYYSKKQYERSLNSTYNMYADTYGLILFKQGKIKEAITYQEKAVDDGKSMDINARYIEFLMADKQYEQVTKKAEEFIQGGNSNEKLNEYYKTAYFKTNPNGKDFEHKLKSLEATAKQNALAEVKKSMLDEEAPTFTLKDMKGNMVSLESLKGKTVILDFWATWCGPCKASFPGMQQVVTKYKDNDNVKLLFVDTFESGQDREKNVEDFIKKNKYTFHVVYDTDDNDIAGKYGVTGIPTKVVIGPDGKIKFKAVGFSGSNDKLVNEMDMMIEAIKP